VQTVGEILRSEREKKGLSVKEIEFATSIRTIYISAIEEGNYSIIPGEVYLKGFIRNYSNFLGLDGQQIVDLYRQSQNSINSTQELIPNVNKSSEEQPIKKTNPSINIKRLTVSLLALCAIGGASWWLFNTPESMQEPRVDTQVQPTPVIPSQAIKEQSNIPSTPVTKPVTIIAKYTDQCWTSVTADNKMIYEGTPQAGETLTWAAEQNITIKAGNAGGVDIVYNGQSLGKLGTKGEVIVKTFSASK
jgi:cytoskeletal protein RodZ